MKGARVGQAVSDITSKDQPTYTVGEILDGFSARFAQELEVSVNDGLKKYKSPFYVLALTKKEFWADNIVRNWFIPRQTAPHALELMRKHPTCTKTLYVVEGNRGDIKVAWSIPAYEDCISIMKNPSIHSPELIRWIKDCFEGKLDLDSYDYLFK
ncbi:MAG: hypothetical protein LLG04_19030 [Parachlamydia sp.]|nr:hypothetical protein [Parachlamydia sp.]